MSVRHRLTIRNFPQGTQYECSCGESQGFFSSPLYVTGPVRRRQARRINRVAHQMLAKRRSSMGGQA